MKRLDIGEGTYALELEEDFRILDGVSQIQSVVLANEAECAAFKASFVQYEYLWREDLQQLCTDFIEETARTARTRPWSSSTPRLPSTRRCRRRSRSCTRRTWSGWIKIDAKPIKQALATWVTKWVFLFTQYLSNKLTESMRELYAFRAAGEKTLEKDPSAAGDDSAESEDAAAEAGAADAAGDGAEGDGDASQGGGRRWTPESKAPEKKSAAQEKQETLYEVMGFMRDVRKRQEKTDAMFEPLVGHRGAAQDVRHLGFGGDPPAARGGPAGVVWHEEEGAERPREALADATAGGAQDSGSLGRVRGEG